MRVRLDDDRDYAAAVDVPDLRFQQAGALFAASGPPESALMNLFVLDGGEEGDPIDMAVELWRLDGGVDEPSAVQSMRLEGLKDFYEAVGRAIALLEE